MKKTYTLIGLGALAAFSAQAQQRPNIIYIMCDDMGYGDLRASYTFGKQRLSALWRNNLHFDGSNRGAIELNYSFPIFNSGFYGYLRYFNGYGESLADYKRSVNKIGIGLSFVEF